MEQLELLRQLLQQVQLQVLSVDVNPRNSTHVPENLDKFILP